MVGLVCCWCFCYWCLCPHLGRTAGAGVLLVVVAAVVEGGGGWVGGGGAAAGASATGACAHILQPKFRNSTRNQKKYRTVLHH